MPADCVNLFVQDDSIYPYHRAVVHQRHFGIVHRQKASFSNIDGSIIGRVQKRKWWKPWQIQTESFSIDVSRGAVVPGVHWHHCFIL